MKMALYKHTLIALDPASVSYVRVVVEMRKLIYTIDPVVCVNVLTFFFRNGRGHELPETFSWVLSVLEHRDYAHGTLYYATPDAFLFFFSRLLSATPPDALPPSTRALFAQRVRERLGAPGDAFELSARVLVAAEIGIISDARKDCMRLLEMQDADGSWPAGWFYRYGSSGILLGNQGLTTAMAAEAVRRCRTSGAC